MGFRNPITTVAGVDTGAGVQRVRITDTGGSMGGGAVLLYPASDKPGVLEAASDDAGATASLSSPPNLAGRRASLILRGVDVGTEGAWLETPPGTLFYVNGKAYRPPVAPRIITDNGPGGTFVSPGPFTMHPARTIDPAALFGDGYGALVLIHAQVVADSTGVWQFQLRAPALGPTLIAYAQVGFNGVQRTAEVTEFVLIPAGQSSSFSTSFGGGTASITTYADARNNRVRYVVLPIAP